MKRESNGYTLAQVLTSACISITAPFNAGNQNQPFFPGAAEAGKAGMGDVVGDIFLKK